jgi:MHS family proline/betaine transporter-like MFS transporter
MDFAIYGYLTVVLAALFFPPGNPSAALILTLTTFAAGFGARIIGGMVLGPLGDKAGRRIALAATIAIMALSTFAIGLLPTYAQVGILAPILLFLARFLQGFAAGGEYGASTSFLVEYAPEGKRGFFGSWQQFSVIAGALAASLGVTFLTTTMPESTLNAWGWRVPFIFAAFTALFGLYLRLSVDDTPKFQEAEQAHAISDTPLRESIRANLKPMLTVIGFCCLWTTTGVSTFGYTVTYATTVGGLELSRALLGSTIALVYSLIIITPIGALSDRFGRKPVLLAGAVSIFLFSYPAYWLMSLGSFWPFLLGLLLMFTVLMLLSGPTPAALAELFTTRVRVSAVSQAFNVAIIIFGGTAPLAMASSIQITGYDLAPPFIIMATALVGLVVISRFKETANEPLQ